MIRMSLQVAILLLIAGTTYGQTLLPGLTTQQKNLFNQGKGQFTRVWTVGSGLGPIYNDISCSTCHPAGGASTRISNSIGAGVTQNADGGPVIQLKALRGFSPEAIPTNVPVGRRRAMTTLGLGLVGNIPDNSILAVQAAQQNTDPTTAGQANIVIDSVTGVTHVGRIGQKSQHPNSTSFAAEAVLREIGITTPYFPHEEAAYNNPANLTGNPFPIQPNDPGATVIQDGRYMDMTAPPKAAAKNLTTAQKNSIANGSNVFASIGCATCHVPSWTTGTGNSIAPLNNQVIFPYSDFLLHDMGANGDQVQQGTNSNGQPIPGSWMRTTPLWGVSTNTAFWHDASANSISAAISKHAGQATGALTLYNSLNSTSKQDLLNFLNSL